MRPFDHDALWMKAKLLVARSFDASDRDAFDESALWAACSLELLGKAALSKVNPLLIADPTDDGKSLLIAAGLSTDFSGFKSIQAKAVFARCAKAFRPFDAARAGRIAGNRNVELHSGTPGFGGMHEDSWWQTFWAEAAILVQSQDLTLEDLVGADRVDTVEAFLARNRESIRLRVESLLERAGQRLQLLDSAALSAKVDYELRSHEAMLSGEHYTSIKCPVCGNQAATLYGDFVLESEVHFDEEDGFPWATSEVAAESFSCDRCGLVLLSEEFLAEAGLPDTFEVEAEYQPVYDEYMNE